MSNKTLSRCGWLKLSDPVYVAYHDEEWGKPLYDDRALFELFCLETQSAGLSWLTILKKREGYRKAFANFDLNTVAMLGEADIVRILQEGEVIKSRPKLEAIIHNAKCVQHIVKEFGAFKTYLLKPSSTMQNVFNTSSKSLVHLRPICGIMWRVKLSLMMYQTIKQPLALRLFPIL